MAANEFDAVELAAIVFAEESAGEAAGNVCGSGSTAVIAVSASAAPTLVDNECEIVEAR